MYLAALVIGELVGGGHYAGAVFAAPLHVIAAVPNPAQPEERSRCPRGAITILRAYIDADTTGARQSSEAWERSRIDTLTWDPHHDEPAYDGAVIVTGFIINCLAAKPDSAVLEVTWDAVGAVSSGEPVEWKTQTLRDSVVLRRLPSGWRLSSRASHPEQLWFGPCISPATALATAPWLGPDDRNKLKALTTRDGHRP